MHDSIPPAVAMIAFLGITVGIQMVLAFRLWRVSSGAVGLLGCAWLISWWSLPVPVSENDVFKERLTVARAMYVVVGFIAFLSLLVFLRMK